MTIRYRKLMLWLAAAGLLGPPASRAELACPDSLEVQQRATAPAGWNASYSEQAPRLDGVTIFDGPPANRASIKYNLRRQTGSELRLRWDLTYSPRSYYLQCHYERTTALISAPLPAGVRGCEVAYDRNVSYPGGGMAVKRTVCR